MKPNGSGIETISSYFLKCLFLENLLSCDTEYAFKEWFIVIQKLVWNCKKVIYLFTLADPHFFYKPVDSLFASLNLCTGYMKINEISVSLCEEGNSETLQKNLWRSNWFADMFLSKGEYSPTRDYMIAVHFKNKHYKWSGVNGDDFIILWFVQRFQPI